MKTQPIKELRYAVIPVALTVPIILADIAFGDLRLFTLINHGMANPILDVLCGYFSAFLFISTAIISLIIQFFSNNEKENRLNSLATGLLAIISAFAAYYIGSLLKLTFRRPRPSEVLDVRIVGLLHTSTFSFPSTTTMFVFGFALPILYERPRAGLILTFEALFVGFSVMYAGFHYPSDVAAGILLSTGLTVILNYTKRIFLARIVQKSRECDPL
ncbi:phosphatase PAP2 family protein [Candidatus Bathyarchaeota archaeon]|nr:phosphatase PAP2 family protein [Candidatus Bathyarchaeota archaeon]